MFKVFQLAYLSTPTNPMNGKDLKELLTESRKFNQSANITGLLLACKDSFFQIIEGEKQAIDELYEKICQDERHTNVRCLLYDFCERRTFAEWSMAFHQPSDEEIKQVPGFSDFLMQYNKQIDSEEFISSTATQNISKPTLMAQEMKKIFLGHY